jgi:hypothetical protein
MAADASMALGQALRPITNALHQDHRGIRRVRQDGPVRALPLLFTAEHIVTKPHPPYARVCAWLVALLVLAGGSLGFASDARADSTVQTVVCWKRLLNDWYDGRIDRAYPVRCYRDAIANLPEDVKVYADAEADIRRALLAAIRQSTKDSPGTKVTESTPVKPPPKPKPPAARPQKPTSTKTERGNEQTAAGPTDPGPDDPFAGAETLTTGATRSADSLPLPLLVLGALALLLLAAAGAGVVNKRLQARRIAAAPPPTEEPPPVV